MDTYIAVAKYTTEAKDAGGIHRRTLCGADFDNEAPWGSLIWHPKIAAMNAGYQRHNDSYPATCMACILLLFQEGAEQ